MISTLKYLLSLIYTLFKFTQKVIVGPAKKLWKRCDPLTSWYAKKWKQVCYDKYGDFLWKKAAKMIAATVCCFYLSLCVLGFIFDLGYYLSTKRVETIYLSDSVELEDDLWSAKGCKEKQCTSDNAVYFRIRNTWFNNVWSICTHGQIFLPDITAAVIPTGQARCKVVSYGLRYRIAIVFNYFPQILQAECEVE